MSAPPAEDSSPYPPAIVPGSMPALNTTAVPQKRRISTPRRGTLNIKFDVLRAIRDGPSGKEIRTRVMYKANLSWSICLEMLGELEKAGLVKTERRSNRDREYWGSHYADGPELHYDGKKGQKVLSLTEKGVGVVLAYEKILEDIDAEECFRKTPLIKRSYRKRGFKTAFSDGSSKTVGRGLVSD